MKQQNAHIITGGEMQIETHTKINVEKRAGTNVIKHSNIVAKGGLCAGIFLAVCIVTTSLVNATSNTTAASTSREADLEKLVIHLQERIKRMDAQVGYVPRVPALIKQGEAFAKEGEYILAIRSFAGALALEPTNRAAKRGLQSAEIRIMAAMQNKSVERVASILSRLEKYDTAEVSGLRTDLQTQRSRLNNVQKKAELSTVEMGQLSKQIQTLIGERDSLKQQLAAFQSGTNVQVIQARADEAELQVINLTKKVATLTKQVALLVSQRDAVQKQAGSLQASTINQSKSAKRLQADVISLTLKSQQDAAASAKKITDMEAGYLQKEKIYSEKIQGLKAQMQRVISENKTAIKNSDAELVRLRLQRDQLMQDVDMSQKTNLKMIKKADIQTRVIAVLEDTIADLRQREQATTSTKSLSTKPSLAQPVGQNEVEIEPLEPKADKVPEALPDPEIMMP